MDTTKGAFHKAYYKFAFTVKVTEDAVSSFGDIVCKPAWMYNFFATQASQCQKELGGATNFVLWVLFQSAVYNILTS